MGIIQHFRDMDEGIRGTQNFDNPDLQPYADGECQHRHRSPYHGTEKCNGCGKVYNETLMEWRDEDAE